MAGGQIDQSELVEPRDVHGQLSLQRIGQTPLPAAGGGQLAGLPRRNPVVTQESSQSGGLLAVLEPDAAQLAAQPAIQAAYGRRNIGRPRPMPGCPTALALYPISVRRPPVLPPASSPPRITATQLPPVQARGRLLASGSAPCGPQRTCTSKFSSMPGTHGPRLSPGQRSAHVSSRAGRPRRTVRNSHRHSDADPTGRQIYKFCLNFNLHLFSHRKSEIAGLQLSWWSICAVLASFGGSYCGTPAIRAPHDHATGASGGPNADWHDSWFPLKLGPSMTPVYNIGLSRRFALFGGR